MSTYHEIPKRASYRQPHAADVQVDTEELPAQQEEQKQEGCLGPVLIGMAIVILAYVGWNGLVVPTATNVSNNFTYGQARISEITANVGHGGESTFLALMLHNKAVVIECVGTPTKCTAYPIGTLENAGTDPVLTLSVKDVNNDGKPDLLVGIQGSQSYIVLLNTGTGFQLD